MKIILNGEKYEIENANLSVLLAGLNLTQDGWAMALNGEFIPKNKLAAIILSEFDEIDIVRANPGG